jgi:hypothetical protein
MVVTSNSLLKPTVRLKTVEDGTSFGPSAPGTAFNQLGESLFHMSKSLDLLFNVADLCFCPYSDPLAAIGRADP